MLQILQNLPVKDEMKEQGTPERVKMPWRPYQIPLELYSGAAHPWAKPQNVVGRG